jgi:hypothetical protein
MTEHPRWRIICANASDRAVYSPITQTFGFCTWRGGFRRAATE